MSCWHLTVALRIPASALGFKYLREWKEFLQKHEDDFCWEEGCFGESMCDCILRRRTDTGAFAGGHSAALADIDFFA